MPRTPETRSPRTLAATAFIGGAVLLAPGAAIAGQDACPPGPPSCVGHLSSARCHSRAAGILHIDACTSTKIGIYRPYRQIARAFRRAGYYACVKRRYGRTSVRVYGFPKVSWDARLYETRCERYCNVLEIWLCN